MKDKYSLHDRAVFRAADLLDVPLVQVYSCWLFRVWRQCCATCSGKSVTRPR